MKATLGTEESDRCREMGGPFGKTGELYDNFFLGGVYHFRFLENILSTHITLMTRNKKKPISKRRPLINKKDTVGISGCSMFSCKKGKNNN